MLKEAILIGVLATAVMPAWAVEEMHCGPKDPRVCTAVYDPNNIIHIWSAPGSQFVIKLAPDEDIKRVKSDDLAHLGANGTGAIGNLLNLKFNGCLVPEPLFVYSVKGRTEARVYAFQVDTIPRVCSDKIPGPRIPMDTTARGGVIPAANAAVLPPPVDAMPNLVHLEHPDDLETGRIPYMLTILYPGDAAAKRRATYRARRVQQDADLAKRMIKYGSGNINYRYFGFGDGELKPSSAYDDGYTTTLIFPQMKAVPTLSRVESRKVPWCGAKESGEATADFAIEGSQMRVTGTAQAWCLRYGNEVYEVWDGGYNPTGFTPGTGTTSPQVDRVVAGPEK